MRFGLRFWPPQRQLDPNVHWLLLRAWGPITKAGPKLGNATTVVELAARLGLRDLITSRCTNQQLSLELGDVAFARWEKNDGPSEAGSYLGLIDDCARSLNAPYALLGAAALLKTPSATIAPGFRSRSCILVHPEHRSAFSSRLRSRFRKDPFFRYDPEIISHVNHVRLVPGGESTTFRELLESYRTTPVEGLSEFAHLPGPDFLLAHTLSQLFEDNGFLPHQGPGLSLLAALISLKIVENPTQATQALWWVQPDVSYHEVTAARDLAKALLAGDIEQAWYDEGRTGRLLRHLVFGCLDHRYAAGLLAYEALFSANDIREASLEGSIDGTWRRAWAKHLGRAYCATASAFPRSAPRLRATTPMLHLVPQATLMLMRQSYACAQIVVGCRTF